MKYYYFLFLLILLSSCRFGSDSKKDAGMIAEKLSNVLTESQLINISDSIVEVKGIIQSSGIQFSDQLGIAADFQITNPFKSYFLISKQDLLPYWGECVIVKGKYLKGWESDSTSHNGKYTYMRSAILLDSISKIPNTYCLNSPIFELPNDSDNVTSATDTTINGIIVRIKRMAPDINYDYGLKLENSALLAGETSSVGIIPITINMELDKLNEAITNKKQVRLTGKFMQGYAESTIFSGKKCVVEE